MTPLWNGFDVGSIPFVVLSCGRLSCSLVSEKNGSFVRLYEH
jgi:hypothetical protein